MKEDFQQTFTYKMLNGFSIYCGAGGIRTLVQTRNYCAFYALITLLIVGLELVKMPT